MKNQISLWVGSLLLAGVLMAPQVGYAQCSDAMLMGGWGYELSGVITLSSSYSFTVGNSAVRSAVGSNGEVYSSSQFRDEAGLFTFDGAGNFTLKNTGSINGLVTRWEVSQGQYTVNPVPNSTGKCTGTLVVHRDPYVVHFAFTLNSGPFIGVGLGLFPGTVLLPTGMALTCTDPDAQQYSTGATSRSAFTPPGVPAMPAGFYPTYTGTAAPL